MKQSNLFTNEEKRVISYNTGTRTNPRFVTPTTPLDKLNLNWREKDLPERKRTKHVHRLQPDPGRFQHQRGGKFLR